MEQESEIVAICHMHVCVVYAYTCSAMNLVGNGSEWGLKGVEPLVLPGQRVSHRSCFASPFLLLF